MKKYSNQEKITFALSMRLHKKEYTNGNSEIYNVLSQDWYTFLENAFPKCTCLALPNSKVISMNILAQNKIDMLILTGGDDWGVFPERDEMEFALLDFTIKYDIPVLGVCRGMQVINKYFGGESQILPQGHIATRHSLLSNKKSIPLANVVNSYHANGIFDNTLAKSLQTLDYAKDKSIEAFMHEEKKIYGIMWHPERELIPQEKDIMLIKYLLK